MEAAHPEDERLVAAYLQSRAEADFMALYQRHTPSLYRFAGRLAGGPGVEAAEVVQETWVRAVSRLDRFAWRCSLRTWLCAIAVNVRRELVRRTSHDRRIATELSARAPVVASSIECTEALGRALSSLAEGYREVIVLHDIEGYTHAEIARHFGISEGTSKSQLARGRRALRAAVAGREGIPNDR